MTPLEFLRSFLQTTTLTWIEHFNPTDQKSLVSVHDRYSTSVYLFDKQGRLMGTGNSNYSDGTPALPAVPQADVAAFYDHCREQGLI